MKRLSFRSVLLALASTLIVVACGDKLDDSPVKKTDKAEVGVERFAVLRFFPEREAPATTLGKNETRLAAETAGRILDIKVDSGDQVKAGQLLIQIDPRDAELALARAAAALAQTDARLTQAQAQMARARSLREKNFISEEALSLRKTELALTQADQQAARANRDSAQRNVEKCRITAPFAAIVRSRTAQVGELAAPGSLLLSLADISELQIVAQVQARDAESLKAAAKVEFAAPNTRYVVKPLRISTAINREARIVEARFGFTTPPAAPGTEGRLLWADSRPHLAPEYILRRDGKYGVFVLEGDKVRFHVLPQAQEGRPASADFSADTAIVTHGRHALQDGMTVAVSAK